MFLSKNRKPFPAVEGFLVFYSPLERGAQRAGCVKFVFTNYCPLGTDHCPLAVDFPIPERYTNPFKKF